MFGIQKFSLQEIAETYAEHMKLDYDKVYELVINCTTQQQLEEGLHKLSHERYMKEYKQNNCSHDFVNVGFNTIVMACKYCGVDY